MKELTPKQHAYIRNLINGDSQRMAYIKSGYNVSSLTNEQIDYKAHQLLKEPHVKAEYNKCIDNLQQRILDYQAMIHVMDQSQSNMKTLKEYQTN